MVPVRMSALWLSAAMSPSTPCVLRMAANSERRVATSNCTIQINIRDEPALAILAHYIVDLDRLTVALDDAALHHEPERSRLLAGHLKLLSAIAVETVGIDRRDVTAIALGHFLAPRLA